MENGPLSALQKWMCSPACSGMLECLISGLMRLKMVQNHLVLLPGLDGTGELFAPFVQSPSNHFSCTVVSYPRDKLLNYQQLIPRIREAMPWNERFVLLAESFSGPLAFQFAAVQPE